MSTPQSLIFKIANAEPKVPITFWLIGLGYEAAEICRQVSEETQTYETVSDELGLSKYFGEEKRVKQPGVPFTCIAKRWPGDIEKHWSFVIDYSNRCDHTTFHRTQIFNRHSRSCLRRHYSTTGQDEDLENFLIRNRPTSDGGLLVPIVLVSSEDPSTVLLQQILMSFSTNDGQSPVGQPVIAPIVGLLQSDWPHRNNDDEGLINSIALQSEILNGKLGAATTRTTSTGTMNDAGDDVLYVAISNRGGNFEKSVVRFVSQNLLDTDELRKIVNLIAYNERSVDRPNVVAASIPKIRLSNSSFTILDINQGSTPFEDDQRFLLERNQFKQEKRHDDIESILHSMCWVDGDFTLGLPMRENYFEHVLIGYVIDGSKKIEAAEFPLDLVLVIKALANAMVMYGPLGFLEVETIDWKIQLDTRIADELRLIGKEMTSVGLAETLSTESGKLLQDFLTKKKRSLGNHCRSDISANPSARDFAELDLARALVSLCQVTNSGGAK